MDISKYRTVTQVAKILHRNRSSVTRMCQKGVFPHAEPLDIGWLIPESEIDLGRALKPGAKPKTPL